MEDRRTTTTSHNIDLELGASVDAATILRTTVPMGVSAAFLRKFRSNIEPHATTSDVCRQFILPGTSSRQCAYIELLDGQLSDDGFKATSPATVFVSHAWRYRFHHVVEAMLDYAADHPNAYFWFDLFVNNQNKAADLPQDWWSTTFKSSIRAIGAVMLVLSPWNDPVPMTRAWCLWEILCAVTQTEVEFSIRLPRSQRRAFHDGLADNFDVILDSLRNVDARKAGAYREHDKDMIFKAIEDSIGFDLMNERVKEPLRKWYLQTTIDVTNAMVLMEDPSERQGRLLLNVGRALFDFGRYEPALHFLRFAAATLQNVLGDIDGNVAEALQHQARALMSLGRLDEAIETAARSLTMRRKVYGEQHLKVAECFNTLGLICSRRAEYDRALNYYTDALTMQEALVGEAHEDVGLTLNNMGNTYSRKGQRDTATTCLERAYALRVKVHGHDHPTVATTLNALGNNAARSAPKDAMKHYSEALAIREAVLGKAHPDTGQSCNNLANVLSRQGQVDKAMVLYHRALAIRKASLGERHADVAITLNNLAGMHARNSQYQEAIEVSEEALAIRVAALGDNHPDTAASRTNLAKSYLAVKRWADAKCELELAFVVRKLTPNFHDGYPYVSCCDYLVQACEALGLVQEALMYAQLRLAQPCGNEGALRKAQKQVQRLQEQAAKSASPVLATASLDIQSQTVQASPAQPGPSLEIQSQAWQVSSAKQASSMPPLEIQSQTMVESPGKQASSHAATNPAEGKKPRKRPSRLRRFFSRQKD
eukprot:m.126950 g.126950  ORF g.126950 m.126950 type:complete len:767 (-) comp15788_c0_seq1:79-2379(-)